LPRAARLLPPGPSKKRRAGATEQQQALPADLSGDERAVMNLLSADGAVHIDALAGATHLNGYGVKMSSLIKARLL
jgi:hypothetical protein